MLSGHSTNMEDMVPRSRSGEGDTRMAGDINPPPVPHYMNLVELIQEVRVAARFQSPPASTVPSPHLGILGEGGIVVQPHTDGVLALPRIVEEGSTDSTFQQLPPLALMGMPIRILACMKPSAWLLGETTHH